MILFVACNFLAAQATGVRSIKFHPDGRTLFCGLDDCLKVLICLYDELYHVEGSPESKH